MPIPPIEYILKNDLDYCSGNIVALASAWKTRVPRPLKDIALQIAKVLPASLSVPVALGDVRMYVCRKKT